MTKQLRKSHPVAKSLVLYCLIVDRSAANGQTRFLIIDKKGTPAFPPTKFRSLMKIFMEHLNAF